MLAAPQLLDHCAIKLSGSDASKEILGAIEEVVVEDDMNLPTIITIRLTDPGLQLIDDASLAIGSEIEVKIERLVSETGGVTCRNRCWGRFGSGGLPQRTSPLRTRSPPVEGLVRNEVGVFLRVPGLTVALDLFF